MSSDGSTVSAPTRAFDAPESNRGPAVWPAVALAAGYWTIHFVVGLLDVSNSQKFFFRLLPLLIATLLFVIWFVLQRGIAGRERFAIFGWAVACAIGALWLRDESIHGPLLIGVIGNSLRVLITGWAIWLVAARRMGPRARRWGLVAVAALAWVWCLGVRMEGLGGQGEPAFFARWTPSAEERFAAERAAERKNADGGANASTDAPALAVTPEDWPGFRGPARDGVARNGKVRADWKDGAPKQLWRHRVGPGWSSIAVVGNRAFTQEQRESNEAVVCFDADTGREIWAHEDPGRFDEAMGGVGPRSTPTFDGGKLYSLGAKGVLNCLEASTGRLVWQRDIANDGGRGIPYWGFSSSPLVVDGKVIVFAGGGRGESKEPEAKGLEGAIDPVPASRAKQQPGGSMIAYDALTGEIAWQADGGGVSYSSPQLVELHGKKQVVFVSDVAATSFNLATGERLWSFPSNAKDGAPSIQPHFIGTDQFLVSFNGETGLVKFAATDDDGQIRTELVDVITSIKPFFNDFVQFEDHLYGFDGGLLCCIDAATGKRSWKKGRYGSGQLLLLADQAMLLVISEAGEAVLVSANPKKHEELARFQAITGKTWNHPTVVRGRLYVRNAEELACYDLMQSPAE